MPIQILQDILDRLGANDPSLTELDLTDPNYVAPFRGDPDPTSNPKEFYSNIEVIKLLKQALQNNTHLKKLNLANRWLGDEGMRILMPISSLTELNAERNNLTNKGLAIILKNKKLRTLDISFNNIKIDVDVGKKLAESQLIKLTTRYTELGDTGADYLSQNTSLLELDISGSEITDTGIKALAKHPRLRTLTVERNELIGDASLEALAANETLVSLIIKSYRNTKAGIQAFYNSKLSHLDLDVREAYEDVIEGFINNTYLQSFEHSCCGKHTATFSEIESTIEMQLEKNRQNYQTHLKEFMTKLIILAAGFKDNNSRISQLPLEIVQHIISLLDEKTLKKMPEQIQGCAHFIFENYAYIRQQMKQGKPLQIKDKLILDPQPAIEFTFKDEKSIKAESSPAELHNHANTANTCLTGPYATSTHTTSSFFNAKKRKMPGEFDIPTDNSCMPKPKRIRLN